MASYTAYLPPEGGLEDARFVADKFSLFALLFPPVFLAWHRLWLALAGWLLAVVALAAISETVSEELAALLGVLPGIFIAIEGSQMVRARLERLGWREAGSVNAANRAEAELRFFHALPAAVPAAAERRAPQLPLSGTAPAQAASLGIFPQ